MKKLLIAALSAATALTGVMSTGVAAAQPYDHQDGGGDHRDQGGDHRDNGGGHRDNGGDHRDQGGDHRDNGGDRRYGGGDQRDWGRGHDQGDHHWRYYGGRYGYNGYQGRWREGQRYPHWRDRGYVVQDWRAYNLPPPRPGYRYYRDDNGDIVMAAVASGMIGLILGGALSH